MPERGDGGGAPPITKEPTVRTKGRLRSSAALATAAVSLAAGAGLAALTGGPSVSGADARPGISNLIKTNITEGQSQGQYNPETAAAIGKTLTIPMEQIAQKAIDLSREFPEQVTAKTIPHEAGQSDPRLVLISGGDTQTGEGIYVVVGLDAQGNPSAQLVESVNIASLDQQGNYDSVDISTPTGLQFDPLATGQLDGWYAIAQSSDKGGNTPPILSSYSREDADPNALSNATAIAARVSQVVSNLTPQNGQFRAVNFGQA